MEKPTPTRWHAVSIVASAKSCDAARALKARRFLSKDAPRLPLAECSHPSNCSCTYRKHADRRAGPRREEEKTGLRRPGDQERRTRRGRRSTDVPEE